MKRAIDLILSILALIVLSPLLFLIAIILFLTGEHYIFYSHDRVGSGGKIFKLLKFATMKKNSPNLGTKDITIKDDPRVLPFGKFLRKSKINELPQLFNIIMNDMSLVGPRPLTPRNFSLYQEDHKIKILTLKPGLTGIGSIVFRDEEAMLDKCGTSVENFYKANIAPYKGSLESWYSYNKNICLDFKLMALTILIVVFPNIDVNYFIKNLPERPNSIEK